MSGFFIQAPPGPYVEPGVSVAVGPGQVSADHDLLGGGGGADYVEAGG